MPGSAESLRREVAHHEEMLARLAREHREVAQRLADLKAQLIATKAVSDVLAPKTPAEKVAMFRERF